MKKKIIILVTTAITAGVIYGLSEYFRKPMSAIDQKVDMTLLLRGPWHFSR